MNIMWFLNSLRILYKYEAIESSKFEFLEKSLLEAEDNTSGPLDGGGYSMFTFIENENIISNSPKIARAKFLVCRKPFCFISISKFGSFKIPFYNHY